MRRSRCSLGVPGIVVLLALSVAGCAKDGDPLPVTAAPPPGKELNSGDIMPGGTYGPHQFNTAGSYPYVCIYHAPMIGTVLVSDTAASTADTVRIVNSSQPFAPASVRTHGTVVWTNNTGALHTVTSNP